MAVALSPAQLTQARKNLDDAIIALDAAYAVRTKAVADLHLAELNERKAQAKMRECYHIIAQALA